MNSDDHSHRSLADYVKGVHAHLRQRVRDGEDANQVWADHISREKDMRQRYASSMHELAINHWDKSHATLDSEVKSRIKWIRNNVLNYFLHRDEVNANAEKDALSVDGSGLFVAACKDIRRDLFRDGLLQKDPASGRPLLSSSESEKVAVEGTRRWKRCVFGSSHKREEDDVKVNKLTLPKLRLLDVGSCFDPFSRFPEFESVAVDISPSTDTVYEMDFIEADLVDDVSDGKTFITTKIVQNDASPQTQLCSLVRNSFHVVVFSLLLEYFPTPRQRWICCAKANEILRIDGILVIATPDSSHVNKRAPQMKSWQKALEGHLGFRRWKYEKLTHLHCMIYRKVAQVDGLSSSVDDFVDFHSLLYIPQDYNHSGTTPVSGSESKNADEITSEY